MLKKIVYKKRLNHYNFIKHAHPYGTIFKTREEINKYLIFVKCFVWYSYESICFLRVSRVKQTTIFCGHFYFFFL